MVYISKEILQVYPNPSSSKTFLQSSINMIGQDFIITDFSGRVMQSGKINSENQEIGLVNLSSGVYLLYLSNQGCGLKINKL